jgi:hypothetical protein
MHWLCIRTQCALVAAYRYAEHCPKSVVLDALLEYDGKGIATNQVHKLKHVEVPAARTKNVHNVVSERHQ